MNLADMLCYADISQLTKIADNYACDCRLHSKHELIQAILWKMNGKESFERSVNDLDIDEVRLLNTLIFEGKQAYGIEDLTARARQALPDGGEDNRSPRDLIVLFKRRGWLFNGSTPQTQYLYHMPEDIRLKARETLQRKFGGTLRYTDAPEAYRDEQHAFAADISFFLSSLTREELPLTTDGSVYKRALQQLQEGFAIKEPPLPRAGWRFGYGRRFRDYPDRFSLLYDYCYYSGYISEDNMRLALTPKGEERVATPGKEELAQICRLWIRLYKGPIPNIVSLVHWVLRLSSSWVTADSLMSCVAPLVKPYYYDTPEAIIEKRVLQMMLHIGFVRTGEHSRLGKVIQATGAGDAAMKQAAVRDDEIIRLR